MNADTRVSRPRFSREGNCAPLPELTLAAPDRLPDQRIRSLVEWDAAVAGDFHEPEILEFTAQRAEFLNEFHVFFGLPGRFRE